MHTKIILLPGRIVGAGLLDITLTIQELKPDARVLLP